MYLVPAKVVPKKTEQQTIGFKGLNKMPVTESGELTAMTNMSSKYSPCLYPRDSREVIETLTSGTALFPANGKLCWVDGTSFYYDGVSKGTVTAGAKSIAEYFGTILIFPDAKYYNYVTNTFGTITTASALGINYVCVHNNRAYGCGGNGFYASKQTDPLTWDDLPVPITIGCSWQTNTGEEGDFTGIISTQDSVFATKEGYLYKLYNDRPANFLLKAIHKSGCIDFRSLVEVNGSLFMLGNEGIKRYSSGMPDIISLNFDETYVSGSAGTDGRKYYISLYNGTVYNLYVYDTANGYFCREDSLHVTDFARIGDDLYVLAVNVIYKFNSGTEVVTWEFESENFSEWSMNKKVNLSVKVMAELEAGSSLSVYCSIDGGTYALKNTTTTTGFRSYEIKIIPQRCHSFKIKLAGTGKVKVFGFGRDVILGSTV